ncbi:hypothetical protein DDZ13_14900 [Coraliomargarita sinensis]|uniref:Uncharacterized protein n=1 Tax=Coraliomargarita sinensis TaxID=2174842 RepID=A0A317ZCJ9_9BACT|nr:hypothetical protein [Coraliomargarita sinensis]PXA02875.1 hypothetical protein DDZ13_14900 [Coraliomargarita sinensis]
MKTKRHVTIALVLVFLFVGCETTVRYQPGNKSIGLALEKELQAYGLHTISFESEALQTEKWKFSRDAYGTQFIIEGSLIKEIKHSLSSHKSWWDRAIESETMYMVGEMDLGLVIQVSYHAEENLTHLIILDKRSSHNQAEVSIPLARPSLTT